MWFSVLIYIVYGYRYVMHISHYILPKINKHIIYYIGFCEGIQVLNVTYTATHVILNGRFIICVDHNDDS